MKHSQVSVRWKEGLHLRPATRLVERAKAFQSTICLKVNERLADGRSILAVLLLCATFGSVVDLEVSGEDEDQALAAVTAVFESENSDAADVTDFSWDTEDPRL
ncbi:MAG: HPr family phosphocarrier protein [Verrucomicrobiales bacterium]|nr:HPr family phosphocarrier protein [Verrucomicrobiales bacterium]